jgi:hypothetical protein
VAAHRREHAKDADEQRKKTPERTTASRDLKPHVRLLAL